MPAPRRRLLVPALVLVSALAVVGALLLWYLVDQRVAPPQPEAGAAPFCRALDKALPGSLQGRGRQDPRPASPYTAAWDSSPRTVLRCGVPVPQQLIRHPESDAASVNDVDWLIEKQDDGYRFTTVQRRANVEVTVPIGAFPSAADALPQISDAVSRTVPSRFAE
jgi:hypothetical protein